MKKENLRMLSLMSVLFVGLFVLASPVHALECVGVTVDANIVRVVHSVIVLIQIVAPILLVIFGMLDLAKGVMAQKEDEIKKGQQTFIKRLITAAIIFFVIALVRMLVSFVTGDGSDSEIMTCIDAFINGENS